MLDICKPLRGMPQWLQWGFLLMAVIGIMAIHLELPLLFWLAFVALSISLLYGFFQQALRLIRGESVAGLLTGKLKHLDERQVRNDLLAVDITWALTIWVVLVTWILDSKGWLPHGLWPIMVLGVGLIFRFSIRWMLDRYA
ncbi:hypothetical protein AMJ86_02190 [bacterium SM23_57]|nr:MAG: hypothetical protein AMJ86_02190 [bacterium SM23_57]